MINEETNRQEVKAPAENSLQGAFAHGCHFIKDLRIQGLDNIVWSIYPGNHERGLEATKAELERRIYLEVGAS